MERAYLAIGILLAGLLLVALARRGRKHPAVQYMNEEDHGDPLKRWSRGCYTILFGQASPDHRGVEFCRSTLENSWEITEGDQALATISRLSTVPSGHVAWDLVRVVVVARLALGAGFIRSEQAQQAIAQIQPKLQQAYPDWHTMAADYDGMVKTKGIDDSYLQGRPAAEAIWAEVPFK